jgi:hypothetical protein
MKRILIFFAAIFCCNAIFSQVQFEIFAGPILSATSYSIKSRRNQRTLKLGFTLGQVIKFLLKGILFFSPSISYAMRGYKVQFNQPSYPPDLLAIDNNTLFMKLMLILSCNLT